MEISDSIIFNSRSARTYLEVDLSAVVHNVNAIAALSPDKKIMPVLKGNAYGVGAEAVAAELQQMDSVKAFGVDNVYEALSLRKSEITLPIIVLDGDIPDNIPLVVDYDLIPGIASKELLYAYCNYAESQGKKVKIWLYYNCGFNRSGKNSLEYFEELLSITSESSAIEVLAVYSHLTDSNNDLDYTVMQAEQFAAAVDIAKTNLGDHIESSLCASHGILVSAPDDMSDWVRPGILLYGIDCLNDTLAQRFSSVIGEFKPALSLKARLINKIEFEKESKIAYGQTNVVKEGSTIGTFAIGFGNGLPQKSSSAYFSYKGQKLPLFGCVGMDYSQADLTACPDLVPGVWITLFGNDGERIQSAKNFARHLGASPYTLIRGLNVPRIYINRTPI